MELLENIWRPVLEILILAVGIYYAASFVRGTRGAAILTGTLGLMLSLALLSTLLEEAGIEMRKQLMRRLEISLK